MQIGVLLKKLVRSSSEKIMKNFDKYKHVGGEDSVNLELDWIHYITRPYTLFTASIWYLWYESQHWTDFYDLDPPAVLLVEQSNGLVRQYRVRSELEEYNKILKNIILHNRDKILAAYVESDKIGKEAELITKVGEGSFGDLKSAVEYLCKAAFYTTILPFTVLGSIDKYNLQDEELLKKSHKLRSVSHYTNLLNQVVSPLAKKYFEKSGSINTKEAIDVVSYKEILSGSLGEADKRIGKKKDNYEFIIQYVSGNEKIFWIKDSNSLISSIEGVYGKIWDDLTGKIACRGKAKGKVRVIVQLDEIDAFKKGEILVTINSNPAFMPAIKKAAAIITDEGGLSCHAAIISRELGIPCIIGTKIATQVLKDGDMVEVDANSGVVKRL